MRAHAAGSRLRTSRSWVSNMRAGPLVRGLRADRSACTRTTRHGASIAVARALYYCCARAGAPPKPKADAWASGLESARDRAVWLVDCYRLRVGEDVDKHVAMVAVAPAAHRARLVGGTTAGRAARAQGGCTARGPGSADRGRLLAFGTFGAFEAACSVSERGRAKAATLPLLSCTQMTSTPTAGASSVAFTRLTRLPSA